VTNNYLKDMKSQGEGQGIWINSSVGPYVITNNTLEGGTENFITGGSSGCCRPSVTIASATNATSFVLSAHTDLFVGRYLTVANASGQEEMARVTSCGTTTPNAACTSNSVVVTPALTATPSVGADVDWGPVPGSNVGLTFTKNHLYKPTSWRDPILGTPQSVSTELVSGGTLAAGSYYYKVVARVNTANGQVARSTASSEVSCVRTSTGSCKINWAAVTGASSYRIYGRSSGGQNMYWTATAPTVTYTDTGATGTTETVPTTGGSEWLQKNLFELKNIKNALIEGNVLEYSWLDGQDGIAFVLTPANTGNGNDSTTFEDVIIRNNIIRHAPGVFQIMARGGTTGRMENLTVENNLAYDISTAWGNSIRTVLITTTVSTDSAHAGHEHGPLNTIFRHNTFDHVSGNSMLWFDLYKSSVYRQAENITWSDNIASKLGYGLYGAASCSQGNDCWMDHTKGTRIWQNSIVTDATCSTYPGGCTETLAPTRATMQTNYVNWSGGNFRLAASSIYNNAASDGTDIGANIDQIEAFTNVALSGDNTGGAPVVPPSIETPSLSGGTVGATYNSGTIVGICPSTPCVWTSSGTLPTGTSLTSVSSTAATITGSAQASGTFVFSLILTDSGSRTDTQEYSITITEVVVPPDDPDDPDPPPFRPDRINLDERVHFGRATDPRTDGEPTRDGDIKSNTGCSSTILELLETTSPGDAWKPLAFRSRMTPTTIVTAGAVTYTASELLNGLILRDPNGANRSDVTPTAALIVAAIPCAAISDTFEFDIRNTADAAETITVTAGTGVTLSGTMTIAQNNTRRFRAVITNATSGAEAVTLYSIGSFIH
jgi:hypothetical protein